MKVEGCKGHKRKFFAAYRNFRNAGFPLLYSQQNKPNKIIPGSRILHRISVPLLCGIRKQFPRVSVSGKEYSGSLGRIIFANILLTSDWSFKRKGFPWSRYFRSDSSKFAGTLKKLTFASGNGESFHNFFVSIIFHSFVCCCWWVMDRGVEENLVP